MPTRATTLSILFSAPELKVKEPISELGSRSLNGKISNSSWIVRNPQGVEAWFPAVSVGGLSHFEGRVLPPLISVGHNRARHVYCDRSGPSRMSAPAPLTGVE